MPGDPRPRTWCARFDVVDYRRAWTLQQRLVAARRSNALDSDIILLLEHAPVFTLGRRGGRENLVVSEEFLEKSGVDVVHIERGGDVTYHGPGQLVGYPIIDLRAARLRVVDYVHGLEEVMIRAAADLGVPCERNPVNRGVWVGPHKLGSVGIAVRHGISFHGFALNVNTSLEPFGWINPCGLKGVGMTSVARQSHQKISMADARRRVEHHFETVFEVRLETKILDPDGKWPPASTQTDTTNG